MQVRILDQAIMSYSFNLKSNKEDNTKEGKLSLGFTLPNEKIADCLFHIEIETPDYSFKGEFAFHFEEKCPSVSEIKEKEQEFISVLYPYAMPLVKSLLAISEVPSNNLPHLPIEI